MATIILYRADLGDGIEISDSEWERAIDLVEDVAANEDIDIETESCDACCWIFDVADCDTICEIIRAVNGSYRQWSDAALIDIALTNINAKRGRSGKTWWGDGFAGISDTIMSVAGWLIQRGRVDKVDDYLNECSWQLDEDIHPDDLIDIAASTYDLRQRDDGLWTSERFRALDSATVEQAGRLLRRGRGDEAYVALIDGEIKD